jgi:segregation and condensation protein B
MKMNNQRKTERLSIIEAALYASGRPIDMESLKLAVRTRSNKVIWKLVWELAKRYELRGSALEVKALPGNRAVMRLKPKYSMMVKKFTNKPLLTSGPLKTLSYIAYHQPVEQIKVVADRGNHAYAHLKMMEEMGLITRERLNGRGYIIETTAYFSEYFGFGQDPMKSKLQLRQMFSTMKIHKLDNGNGDVKSGAPGLLTAPLLDEVRADSEDVLVKELAQYPSTSNQNS